jgi:hypothetical protein
MGPWAAHPQCPRSMEPGKLVYNTGFLRAERYGLQDRGLDVRPQARVVASTGMVSRMVELPRIEPNADRRRLGFADAVSGAFRYLLEQGFQLVELSDTFARYETADRFVRVFHGRGSYELGVEIGRWIEVEGQSREQAFSLRDVVSLSIDPARIGLTGMSALTPESVRKFVSRLAAWTEEYGSALTTGGDQRFDELSSRNPLGARIRWWRGRRRSWKRDRRPRLFGPWA